jgi:glycosyltransferase involved in cell wall biosynthesis
LIREINPTLIWENVFVGIPNSDLYRYTIDNDLFEFIDDRGLVYLKGHDHRVKRYYGNSSAACMPVKVEAGKVQCPDISVIMSVYNGAKYLKEAVHSILQQTHQNLEFVIVDDGSTDDTWSVLTSLKDPRIVLEKNANNVGLAASLNKAVRVAKGRYVARMDSDDISLPHRLEKQFAFLEDHPECGAVGSSFYEIDENGKIVGITRVPTESSEIRALLREQNCIGHGTVMMRKDVLLTCGGYDERFKYAQDYDLWLRMSEKYEMANIEEPLYCWRSTDSCISNSRVAEQKMYANMALSEARQRLQKPLELRQITAMPIVSVVIPTFNRPDRLQQSIRSVLNQTYQNVEIIVVNDGGTPSENIVCQLAPGAIYVRHDKNRGLAAARNTAIKLARGKYIAYLDDDDRFLPQHLETSVTFLEKNGVSVVYTDAYRVHEIPRRGQYVEVKRDVPYSFDFSEDRILVENFIPVLCVVHERRCLDEVGLFDETLPCLEDWDLWIRMSRLFKFHHLKHITAEFTWREDGSSMTSSRQLEFIECRNVIYRKYRNYSASKPHVMSAQLNLLRRTFNDIQRAMNSK